MVTQLPEDDTNSMTRQQMMARLVVCMGGRAAEEKIFGKDEVTSGVLRGASGVLFMPCLTPSLSTTGASSDVQQATSLARTMVMKYAMSDKVGDSSLPPLSSLSHSPLPLPSPRSAP